MGRGPGRPVKTRRQPHGLGRAARIKPTSHGPRPGHVMDSGPARPINLSKLTARPSPAHKIFDTLDPARPRPSHVQFCRPGPVRPTSIFLNSRPGPSHLQFFRPDAAHRTLKNLDPTRPGPLQFPGRLGPTRPSPSAHGKTSASHDVSVYWLLVGFTLGIVFHLVPRSGASSFPKLPGLQ